MKKRAQKSGKEKNQIRELNDDQSTFVNKNFVFIFNVDKDYVLFFTLLSNVLPFRL